MSSRWRTTDRPVFFFLLLAVSLVFSRPVEGTERYRFKRLKMAELSIEERILSGQDQAWFLERRSLSIRSQTKFDGIIVSSSKDALKLKVVRRMDGDHRVLLGKTGVLGKSVDTLRSLLPEIQRAHLEPYHLLAGAGSRELAVLYVPHGAQLTASPEADGALIQIQLPWDRPSPFGKSSRGDLPPVVP